ncbi:MAG: hypothetical protein H6R17_439 [Proteobacteria bacterium]|nr:hypothetical protein [Pseudomonadota bacterium]
MVLTRSAGNDHNVRMNKSFVKRRAGQLVLLTLFFPLQAMAWNAAGHRLVACIAWDQLDQQARSEVSRLLRQHPDYERWQKRAGEHHPASDGGRASFIESSTWPDEIRKDNRFYSAGLDAPTPTLAGFPDMERRRDWHYVAWPLTESGEARREPVSGRIDQALVAQAQALGAGDEVSRSYALPWLIHMVGDAHQPLHTSVRIDAQGKQDRLGTALSVRNPFAARPGLTTLHAYWDDLPGPGGLRGERLDDDCRTLASAYPRPAPSTPEQWLDEGWQIARRNGYPPGDESVPTISEQFNEDAKEIAKRRVAQAGYRLADLLRERLGSK